MAKQKEKLSPVPNYRPGKKSAQNQRQVSAVSAVEQPPDLAHIVEGLRPLAVPVGDLKFDPANARKHPEKNLDALRGSLAVYGQCKPVVARKGSGVVIAGNGTLQAALALGWTHVAAVYVDMDGATAAGYAIADNRTSDLAEWDRDALDKLLREVSTKNDERLDAMFADLARELKLTPTEARDQRPESPPTNVQATLSCPNCGAVIDKP